MKKIIVLCLTVILTFTSTTTHISAYDNETKSTEPIISSTASSVNGMLILSQSKRFFGNEAQTITKIKTEEGILETTLEGNLVTVRDELGNVVYSTTFKTKNTNIIPELSVFNNNDGISIAASDLAESYNVFGNWYNSSTYVVLIEDAIPTLVNLSAALLSILTANAFTFLLAMSVNSFVYSFYSILTEHTEINVAARVRYNRYCNILVKEQILGTVKGKSYKGTENKNWLDSPWIYGVHPEACRYLTEIY